MTDVAKACPTCGTPRIGSFRFCRSCGLDFDMPFDAESTTTGQRTSPTVVDPGTLPPGATTDEISVPVSGDLATVSGGRRSLGPIAIIGAFIAIGVAGGLAVSGITGSPARVEPTTASNPGATIEPSTLPAAVATASATSTATASPPATVPLPRLTEKVAGASAVNYFAVNGQSPDALLDDVVLRSKRNCKSADTLACVLHRRSIRWTNVTRLATGACTIAAPKVSARSTVYIPQWVGPTRVPPALLTWWKKMVDHMAWHEAEHIKIETSYDSKLKGLMVGHRCSAANRIIDKWARSLDAAQQAFDRKDAQWPYPAYTGP
jgi:predicted secreted Zn-dependent protease